jgi:hypothetical protein
MTVTAAAVVEGAAGVVAAGATGVAGGAVLASGDGGVDAAQLDDEQPPTMSAAMHNGTMGWIMRANVPGLISKPSRGGPTRTAGTLAMCATVIDK